MPNNDLGTAHGRIRVDYDGKGSAAATAALIKMQKQFEEMNGKLDKIAKSLTHTDRALDEASHGFDKVTKSADNYSSGIFRAQKSTSKFVDETQDLIRDLNRLQDVMLRVSDAGKKIYNAGLKLNAYGGALRKGEGDLKAFNIALKQTGFYTNFFGRTWDKTWRTVTGTNKALASMPRWTRDLYGLAGGMTKIAAVGLLAGKALDVGFIKKFTNTRVFDSIVSGANKAGFSIQNLYDSINKKVAPRLNLPLGKYLPIVRQLKDAENSLSKFTENTSDKMSGLSRAFNSGFKPLAEFAKQTRGFVLGTALMVSGADAIIEKFKFLGKIPKPILMALGIMISTVLPAAFQVLGKSIVWVSNTLVGLWSGIKQLSGGLTVLPGLIGTIVTAFSALFPVFSGLKDKFKDIFQTDDPAKAMEAYAKLPPHLKKIADSVLQLTPRMKALKESLQITAFKGLAEQIKTIGNAYLPIFASGAEKAVVSFRNMKNEFVSFLSTQEAQGDANRMYSNTAAIVQNLAKATKPAVKGLAAITLAGSDFLRESSSWSQSLGQKFSNWATVNKSNGNLTRWMQDSRDGVYKLVNGFTDLTKAVWTVLTLFKTNSGNNALDSFAKSMDNLNKKVQESAAVGWLHDFGTSVKEMGSNKIAAFIDIFKTFASMMKSVAPLVQTLSQSFSDIFVPSLKWAMIEIKATAEVLRSLALDKIIGFVLGLAGAFKLLPSILKPSLEALKIFVGFLIAFNNKKKLVSGLETAFLALSGKIEKIPKVGSKASDVIENIGTAAINAEGKLSKFAGLLTKAATAVFVFWSAWQNGNGNDSKIADSLNRDKKAIEDFQKTLTESFIRDRGQVGKNTMQSISDSVNNMVDNAKQAADDMPGVMDHILGFFDVFSDHSAEQFVVGPPGLTGLKGDTWNPLKGISDTDAVNSLQEMATQGKLASEGFQMLRDAGIDVAQLLTSSDQSFKNSIDNLRNMGDKGNAAADKIQVLRDQINRQKEAAKQAGPESILLAEGFQKIAEAAGNTAEKFDGLKQVLEALGIIKPDAIQAAIDYNKSLQNLADTANEIATSGASQSDLISGNDFNYATEAGQNFAQSLLEVASAFKSNIQAGANVDQAWQQAQTALQKIADETKIPIDQLQALATKTGLVRDAFGVPIETIIKIDDEASAASMQVYLEMLKQFGNPIKQDIVLYQPKNAQAIADQINKVLPGYAEVDPNGNLIVKPELDQAQLGLVKAAIDKLTEPHYVDIIPRTLPGQGGDGAPKEDRPRDGGAGGIFGRGYAPPSGPAGKGFANYGAISDYLDAASAQANETAASNNRTSGEHFTQEFAAGIESQKPKVEKAAKNVAKAAKDYMPGSPAKKGPLSGSGWSMIAGKSFSSDFATGITRNAGEVGSAAANVAGEAGKNIKNDKNYQAGQFLGQLTSLVDFAQHAVEAFSKLSETLFSAAKFVSDPLGKGTFFGKRMAYRRDPNVTDMMIKQRKADDAQQRVLDFRGSGQYPQNDGKPTGDLGTLTSGAGKQEIANYIIDKALSLGYSKAQADQFLIQAVGESGLSSSANGGNQGSGTVTGIFQFDQQTWELATGKTDQVVDPSAPADPNKKQPSQKQQEKKTKEEIDRFLAEANDPAKNIEAYFNLAAQRLLNPDNLKDGSQLGSQVSIGGPWHPENQAKGHLSRAQAEAQQYLQNYKPNAGQLSSGITPGLPQNIGNVIGGRNILRDQGPVPSSQASKLTAAILAQQFPELQDILGSNYGHVAGTHNVGKSIDISIPNWNTPAGKALGDRINNWLQSNAQALGIGATIWQDTWKRASDGLIGADRQPGHLDHIDVNFPTGLPGVNPDGTINLSVPTGSSGTRDRYAPPKPPEDTGVVAPRNLVTINPDGSFTPVPDTSKPDSVPINKATGKPWTAEEAAAYWGLPENAKQYDASKIQPGDPNTPGVFNGTPEELAALTETLDPALQGILTNTNGLPDMSTDQAIATATAIRDQIDTLSTVDTPQARAQTSILQGKLGEITSQNGLAETQNPIDQAAAIGGSLSSIAGDIFGAINSGIESVGATKNIADTMVRGIANTEDVFNIVDQVQTYFGFIADIAGAVGSISGGVGAIVGAAGGADPSGGAGAAATALQAVSQIAGLVQSAWETVNAVIDLGQEAYRIVGSYFGQFLGMLTGGPEGALMGNVKFLLDEQVGQLLAYSQDNPTDKRAHDLAYQKSDLSSRNQTIGNINVYGGPGSDPRDNTRQMMFQVKASSMGQATGQ